MMMMMTVTMISTVMTEIRKNPQKKGVLQEAPNTKILFFKFVSNSNSFGVLGDCLPLKLRINGGGEKDHLSKPLIPIMAINSMRGAFMNECAGLPCAPRPGASPEACAAPPSACCAADGGSVAAGGDLLLELIHAAMYVMLFEGPNS